jgi:hypothetical protein
VYGDDPSFLAAIQFAYASRSDRVEWESPMFQAMNQTMNQAIHYASQNGNLDVVRYLVNSGHSTFWEVPRGRRVSTLHEKEIAASKIYFWWIQKCHPLSRPSGIRIMFSQYDKFLKICDT